MKDPRPLSFEEFRLGVRRSFVPLEVEASRPEKFQGNLELASSGAAVFTLVGGSDHTVRRTERLIETEDPNFYKFMLLIQGSGMLIQGRQEATLTPGALAIYETKHPYTLDLEGDARCMVMMLPTSRLGISNHAVRELAATRLEDDTGLSTIVASHLEMVSQNLDTLTGLGGNRLARATVDLVSSLLNHQAASTVELDDPKSGLFGDIVAYIEANLTLRDLSPQTIADSHFISTRLLHSLFQDNGTSVAAWIRARRLEECHQSLSDPLLGHLPVSSIGSRWGFPDPAHFSRTYRNRFGCTPKQTRDEALERASQHTSSSHTLQTTAFAG